MEKIKNKQRKVLILISAAVMTAFMLPALMLTAYANESDIETEIVLFDDGETIVQIGDCDGDGEITVADLTALAKAILNGESGSEALDANGDGKVNLKDLLRLKKYLADNSTPLGKQDAVTGND